MWRINNVLDEDAAIVQRAFSVLYRFCILLGIIKLTRLTTVTLFLNTGAEVNYDIFWGRVVGPRTLHVSIPIFRMHNKHSFQKDNILIAKVYRDKDSSSSAYGQTPLSNIALRLLMNYFIWKYKWTMFQCENISYPTLYYYYSDHSHRPCAFRCTIKSLWECYAWYSLGMDKQFNSTLYNGCDNFR